MNILWNEMECKEDQKILGKWRANERYIPRKARKTAFRMGVP